VPNFVSQSRGLHELLSLEGWQAWVLDGEGRVIRSMGLQRDPAAYGASLDEVLGPEAEVARAALAELEAVGRVAPRSAGRFGREIVAFLHHEGRVVALRNRAPSRQGRDWRPVLNRAAEALGATVGSADAARTVTALVTRHFAAGAAVLLRSGEALVLADARGFSDGLLRKLRAVPDSPGPLWDAIKARSPLLAVDITGDPRFELSAQARALRQEGAAACAVLPLIAGDQRLGCLLSTWREPRLPDPETLAALNQLGRISSVALGRASAYDDLVAERQMMEAVLNSVSDGVLGVGEGAEIQLFNRRLEELVGWTREDIAEEGWLKRVYPDPDMRARRRDALVALVHGHGAAGEVRSLTCKGGGERRMEVRSQRLQLPGERTLLMEFFRDVTREQDERRQALREQNLQRLGRLAGGIAHDFNNILAAILGHADLLRGREDIDPAARSRLDTIFDSAARGSRLANQLLAFGRAGALQTDAVDLAAICRGALKAAAEELSGGAAARLELPPGGPGALPRAEADAGQLEQAVLNLVRNAMEFAGPGGEVRVRLSLRALPEAAQSRAPEVEPGEELLCVAVEDSGPGFSADALDHLFEPFFTTRAQGHGLGLCAVQGITVAHGGAMEVVTDRPAGAEVRLYVPTSERPEARLPGLLVDQPGASRLIWAVDDEPFLLEYVQLLLASRGYRVEIFPAPEQALAAARDPDVERPGLLILDVVMPVMTGPELLEALRDVGLTAPALFVSGYTPEAAGLGDLEPGHFLQKPYTSRDLLASVSELLDQ
jgi:two-component system cell cycle sensor histidine kinase/response regulator CckA